MVETKNRGWGTFDSIREHLFHQFDRVEFCPTTGVPPDDLRHDVNAFLQNHPDMPRVLQKAHAFCIVLAKSRIAIDPADWLVDKIDHGGIVGALRDEWYEEAKGHRPDATNDQRDFYEAVQITGHAAVGCAARYARLAEEMIPHYPQHEPRLAEIARTCRQIPGGPPGRFTKHCSACGSCRC